MRNELIKNLLKVVDKDTYFLTADVGFNVLEPLQKKMKDRFINVGISEQLMISIAAGLALTGKKVYTYTMCAFYLRAIEQIKLDLCYQDAPVTMIGIGTEFDYGKLGTTHYALEDEEILKALRNIEVITPNDASELKDLISKNKPVRPRYLRLSRFDTKQRDRGHYINESTYPKYSGSLEYMLKTDSEAL